MGHGSMFWQKSSCRNKGSLKLNCEHGLYLRWGEVALPRIHVTRFASYC